MAPVFVILPALGIRAGYYKSLATSLTLDGNHVVTFDWENQEGKSMKFSDHGYKEVIEFDLPTVLTQVREHFGDSKIFLLGHSIGVQYGLLYSALNPDSVAGMIAIAGGSFYYKKLKGLKRTKRKIDYHILKNVTKILGHFPGEYIGLSKEPAKLMRDVAKEGLRGSYSHIDESLDQELEKLDIPILFITLNNDRYIPIEGSEFLVSKLKNADLTRIHLRDEYGLRDFHHIKWVKTPEPVVERIQNWLLKSA